MREILFRGKSENDGQWVEGSLVITTIEPADDAPIKHYHIEDMTIGVFPNEFQSGSSETVDPQTVGQFTGLTDKNGKKVFEGDIVRSDSVVHNGELQIPGEVFEVAMKKGCWMIVAIDTAWDFLCSNTKSCEIIGNIHDNPELLEVSGDG